MKKQLVLCSLLAIGVAGCEMQPQPPPTVQAAPAAQVAPAPKEVMVGTPDQADLGNGLMSVRHDMVCGAGSAAIEASAKLGQIPLGMGMYKSKEGSVTVVYTAVNPNNREWTVVVYSPNKASCVAFEGVNFKFPAEVERKAAPKSAPQNDESPPRYQGL